MHIKWRCFFFFTDDQPKIPPWEEEDGIYGIMVNIEKKILMNLVVLCSLLKEKSFFVTNYLSSSLSVADCPECEPHVHLGVKEGHR